MRTGTPHARRFERSADFHFVDVFQIVLQLSLSPNIPVQLPQSTSLTFSAVSHSPCLSLSLFL